MDDPAITEEMLAVARLGEKWVVRANRSHEDWMAELQGVAAHDRYKAAWAAITLAKRMDNKYSMMLHRLCPNPEVRQRVREIVKREQQQNGEAA